MQYHHPLSEWMLLTVCRPKSSFMDTRVHISVHLGISSGQEVGTLTSSMAGSWHGQILLLSIVIDGLHEEI